MSVIVTLTVEQIAQLGIRKEFVSKLIHKGELKASNIGSLESLCIEFGKRH